MPDEQYLIHIRNRTAVIRLLSLLAINVCAVAAILLAALLLATFSLLAINVCAVAASLITAFSLLTACVSSLIATFAVSALGSSTLLCLLGIVVASARNGSEHCSSHCQ